ncbi:hypothetical protein BWI92_18680 [Flectobacillus sp. BAB-3569]|nr:hypothetical protein BWI92_18680 [Flectobacillus sp. BAB-3569]
MFSFGLLAVSYGHLAYSEKRINAILFCINLKINGQNKIEDCALCFQVMTFGSGLCKNHVGGYKKHFNTLCLVPVALRLNQKN